MVKPIRGVFCCFAVLMILLSGCSFDERSPGSGSEGAGHNRNDASAPSDSQEDVGNQDAAANGEQPVQENDSTASPDDANGGEANAGVPTPSEPSEPIPPPTDATWIAAGDVMMHMPQLPAYYDAKTKQYDFSPYFDSVRAIIKEGDWSLANLETPIAGKALGYSGFPMFNAPTELAEALRGAGFTIVTNANNHSLDRGAEGISRTLAALEAQQLVTKGTYRSKAESEKLTIVEKKGIRMGLLAYTYGTNGISLPDAMPYAVDLIDEQKMLGDIAKLKESGADFITVALHFGTEYQTSPSEEQSKLARKLIAHGADIIAGAHPHVVQPYETVEVAEQDGTIRKGLIIYSMGNFISNQRGETKDYGLLMKVGIRKDHATGKTTIQEVEPIPTWVYRYKTGKANHYRIVPLGETIAKRSIPELSNAEYAALTHGKATIDQRLASMSAAPVTVPAAP
ncbi:CapA family protein [Paenibacillus methanolicus]|uniref:Poly-gamma-glutamate synthesis protein (Capsule biosynthesis protein) n=1 Tax=Paenibacillus methanolicus TaxID=582686 RepID=A0A5S5C2G4_9BACL|nr:CapA family protein [Paenibacillus methanolicus]TYP72616.1 poly-gamma-glutamate synthesis protein (capsule biosynthesis protein) [Paenibacillus methanolicus]